MTGGAPVDAPAGALAPVFSRKKGVFAAPRPLATIADTHAHLTCFNSIDPALALARAAAAGVERVVTLLDPVADGLAPGEFTRALASWVEGARELLTAEGTGLVPPRTSFLVGVHPYGAADYDDAVHARVVEALRDPGCAGVGEIGLDYHVDVADGVEPLPRRAQMACMARQLELARDRNLPCELHLRSERGDERRPAHADALAVLGDVGVPRAGCILHCFGEDRATMERFLDEGCLIAFGGAATFKSNAAVREAFAACPLDRILFETDCPYMAPVPLRGLECEPAMIAFTVDALARDRAARTGEDAAAIARAAWTNAIRVFG